MSVRILHVVGDSKFGGASQGILHFAQLWRSQNWNVELLTTDAAMIDAAALVGIPTVPLDVIWREIRPLRDLAGLFRLYRYLRANPYTVVHTHTTKAGFIGRLAARWAGVPVVVHTAHGFAFHEASSKAKIAFYSLAERVASYCCDRVVAVSRFHHSWALQLKMGPPEKWIAIPNGIPQPKPVAPERITALRASWGVTPDTLVVLTHGRLAPEKGLENLVQSAHALKAQLGRPFLVVIAGDGPLRGALERQAESLGVQDHVRFLGFRKDVSELLAATDIVALPSVREGLSIALLEAMAMARPIIATSIGSNREVTREGEGARLIETNSTDELTRAIDRLGRNPNEAEKLGLRAREIYREGYTIDRMMAAYHHLYRDLLSNLGVLSASERVSVWTGKEIHQQENKSAEPVSTLLPSLDR